MTEQQIKDFNHRLATEVMGWQYQDGAAAIGGQWVVWQPHKNIEQALQCADKLADLRKWDFSTRRDNGIHSALFTVNYVIQAEGHSYDRVSTIYAALFAALPQPKEEKPEPPKQPEPPKRKGFGISMSCPHCAHSPYIRDPETEVCLNCGRRFMDD